jgi:hypothetical protein
VFYPTNSVAEDINKAADTQARRYFPSDPHSYDD